MNIVCWFQIIPFLNISWETQFLLKSLDRKTATDSEVTSCLLRSSCFITEISPQFDLSLFNLCFLVWYHRLLTLAWSHEHCVRVRDQREWTASLQNLFSASAPKKNSCREDNMSAKFQPKTGDSRFRVYN